MKGKMCVPDVEDLRKLIMEEAHCSTYAMHLGSTKCIRPSRRITGGLV